MHLVEPEQDDESLSRSRTLLVTSGDRNRGLGVLSRGESVLD